MSLSETEVQSTIDTIYQSVDWGEELTPTWCCLKTTNSSRTLYIGKAYEKVTRGNS